MRTKHRIEGLRSGWRHETGEHRPWSVERLEDRRLRADWEVVAAVELDDELWDVGWSVLFGTLRVGDPFSGVASLELGGALGRTYDYGTWDNNGGRFDSGWRQFWFQADVQRGSVSWYIEGRPQVWHVGSEVHTSVTEVLVVAAVNGPRRRMSWDGLSVAIRDSSGLQGPEYFHGSLIADTFGQSHPAAQEQRALHVYAPAEGLNEVIVQGYVRMEAEAGVQPEPADIFGQVVIRAV